MIKLYKRDAGGALLFHESWVNPSERTVADHWGRVGERGEVPGALTVSDVLSHQRVDA